MQSEARIFAAVPVSPNVQEQLSRWNEPLKTLFPFRKWVDQKDYHITVQFLGNTNRSRIRQIEECLSAAVKYITPFRLSLDKWGYFGNAKNPKILWAGVNGDISILQELKRQTEQALTSLGYPAEGISSFKPHITLARQWKGEAQFNPSRLKDPLFSNLEDRSWTVSQLLLFQTHFQKIPMYKAIASFPFILKD